MYVRHKITKYFAKYIFHTLFFFFNICVGIRFARAMADEGSLKVTGIAFLRDYTDCG